MIEAEDKVEKEKSNKLLEGRDLILHSMRYAVEQRSKSWYYLVETLFFLVASFIGTYYNFHWVLQVVSALLSGLFIVKFFVIYHDYLHGAILQKSALAKTIMTCFGVFVLAPTTIWKGTHDHHHNHNSKLSNSGIGSYPLLSKERFLRLTKLEKKIYLASRHPLTILFGYVTLFLFDFNIKTIFKSPKKHIDSFVALVFHFGVGWVIFSQGGILALALSWIIPFFIADAIGAYLFYAQHNFPGAIFRNNKEWDYTKAAIDSTSFMVMPAIMNWFTGNIGYHHVHHVNHTIPFYQLKTAMKSMPELQNPKTTSWRPKDVAACLRLKVWDDEIGEMTTI